MLLINLHNNMASKRKSSIPCMVPAKTKTQREEFVVGCLPDFLPTIPEDRILNSFGKKEGERHKTSKASCDRGIHSCPPCGFETTDINFFLYHLNTCHINFQTQPLYCCLNCKLSLGRFEDLALHNAKTHPQLHMEGSMAKSLQSLQVTKKDGGLRVEQTLFIEKDELSQSGVSIIKMPLMKMKVNGEQKDGSHVVGNGTAHKHVLPGTTLTNSLTMQKIPNAHNIPAQNNRPLWNFTPRSSDSNSELPKVMIPLSSIPTYDPAMDLSSFLKASFGKFPYPTKAELCYLTVVSSFPEEQIKLWFAAQRLKQGISWSPEEIEDTRKKMFNTVFQVTPKSLGKKSLHQILGQCVAFQPSAVSSGYIPQIMKSNVKKRSAPLKAQGNGQHGTFIKETERFCLDATDSANQATVSEDKLCISSGRPKSENHDGNMINQRKSDCTDNTKQDSTSKPNTHFDTEYRDEHAACPTLSTSSKSNNGTVYSNTSLSIICTKKEGIVTASSKETEACLPIPGVQTSSLSDTLLCKSKSPEELQALTQSIVHSSVPEDKTSLAFTDETVDTQSTTEQFPGSTPPAFSNDNNNQLFNKFVSAQADERCPKAFPGISQVLAAELPLDDAIHYKEHEAQCLKHSSTD